MRLLNFDGDCFNFCSVDPESSFEVPTKADQADVGRIYFEEFGSGATLRSNSWKTRAVLLRIHLERRKETLASSPGKYGQRGHRLIHLSPAL